MHIFRQSIPQVVALSVLLFVALSGCAKEEKTAAAATVDGTTITMSELDGAVESYQQQFESQGQSVPEEQLAAFRSSVLDSMIRRTVLLNQALAEGIEADTQEVQDEIDNIRSQFSTDDEYTQALGAQGYTEESLRTQISEDLTATALVQKKVLDSIEIPEEDVKSFYEDNSQYFIVPETVTASHILVQLAADASEEETAAAREKIDSILAEVKGGADFAEVAKKRSEGPSGPSGGSLGTFGRGQMVPEFEEAAFSLEPGELSDVIRTQFGFHIILLEDKQAGRTQTLDEVRQDIVGYLQQTRGQDQINTYIDGLVAAASIERFIDTP